LERILKWRDKKNTLCDQKNTQITDFKAKYVEIKTLFDDFIENVEIVLDEDTPFS